MKVLLINGSPNKEGCTFTALTEFAKELNKENIETEILQTGNTPTRDCCACYACRKEGAENKCVFNDDMVNTLIEKAKEFDGFVVGSPVYYAHPTGKIISILNRAFFAGASSFEFKPACAVVSARRAGTTTTFDVLNKYFTIANMPVVSGNYWNNVHGRKGEDVLKDLEGLQTMRVLARNMSWMLKCIECGKQNGINRPELEQKIITDFIR